MAACQLCRIDGEAPAFHCRDCNVWICATCRTVHLNISGAGDHDIILAPTKRDQLVNELRALAKRVTSKLEICDVNANRCQAAMRDLKGDNVTSLDASLKAREQTIAKVNELSNTRFWSCLIALTNSFVLSTTPTTASMWRRMKIL